MNRLALLLTAVLWLVLAGGGVAAAHEVRPVFLDLHETGPGRDEATWRGPVTNGMAPPVSPRFTSDCATRGGLPRVNGSAAVSRIELTCPKGLAGTTVTLDGLSHTVIDGLMRLQFASGETATRLVHPANPNFVVPASSGPLEVLRTYGGLGIEHILTGYDHLLFVLALVLFVKRLRPLLLTASAFTVAHSITLSLAALGVIHVPSALMEALIALSILMLAVELVRAQADPARAAGLRPAGLAFAFGLLHGLGFASALAKIGLPAHEIPLSLFGFNVGVEIGQVAFILALLALGTTARRLSAPQQRLAYRACTYAIGSMAAFWTIERVLAF